MTAPKQAADFRPRVEQVFAAFGRTFQSEPGRLLVERATAFAELVVAWNERVDLTAARDPDELVDLLLADAAAIAHGRPLAPGEEWADVGSGVGAPGVALALLEPAAKLTLVEPRARRVAFLRAALHTIERLDVVVARSRSEALSDESCDVAVSRATLPPPEWLREGARLARTEVWVLLAREAAPEVSGWNVAQTLDYRWPLTGKSRRAVRYTKILPTVGS
jgi:16S rRNA (guanine527-N7)-methyltransferase